MKRGIYLVANLKSQEICENLVYSIRQSGCNLPIRIIHFGGDEISSPYLKSEVEWQGLDIFPAEAQDLISNLRSVLTDCPMGFLYRFFAWFSDWDEFIYSDNDVVALCNWDILFEHLQEYDLVHADEEYTTKGKFNYDKPEEVKKIFGDSALDSAFTAGHIVVKRNPHMVAHINQAVEWYKQNPDIPKKHDQALMHIASLLGNWKVLNLCKPPHNWLSSWAGDFRNSLQIIQALQSTDRKISHIHYSGGTPKGNLAIQDLLFSYTDDQKRLLKLTLLGLNSFSGYATLNHNLVRIKRFLNKKLINIF